MVEIETYNGDSMSTRTGVARECDVRSFVNGQAVICALQMSATAYKIYRESSSTLVLNRASSNNNIIRRNIEPIGIVSSRCAIRFAVGGISSGYIETLSAFEHHT